MNRHAKKAENLLKQNMGKEQSENQTATSIQSILAEHQQKEAELKQIQQAAQSRIQSIESLLGAPIPKSKGIGNKIDNLVEQLDSLQQEFIEVLSTIGQLKKSVSDKEMTLEHVVAQANYHPGLWSTDIWKEQQFIETKIREHRLNKDKKIMYDRVLDSLQKQINALEVNPKLENSRIEPEQLLAFLEPWIVDQANRFKEQHSELERQQTQIRHRVNDINLIQNKLSESSETEEEIE